MAKTSKTKLPPYLTDIYSWLYLNPKLYKFLDNSTLLNILTLGYHHLLTEEINKELSPHAKVLQIGVTLGNQIEQTYNSLNALGSYTVMDIVPQLLDIKREKNMQQHISWQQGDAAKAINDTYDTIICYMLLHELPPITRAKLLENIINALKPEGKAIFIDYHLPSSYNPLKYIIRAVNRLYQPFAEVLWKQSIRDLTPNAELCTWSKQTLFGDIYQKVVASKTAK